MKPLIKLLITWPEKLAPYFNPFAPLIARITVGWVFLWSGWGKLQDLPTVTDNFISWGIPYPHILTPFVSGVEFVGGLFLLIGFLTRISAGALGVVMIVAIRSAWWDQIDSFEMFTGLSETAYFAIFFWLAISGAGIISFDYLLQRTIRE